jgi:hypothetical protein
VKAATTRQGVVNLDGPRNGKRREIAVVQHVCERSLVALCVACEQQYIGGGIGCACSFRCRICRRPM